MSDIFKTIFQFAGWNFTQKLHKMGSCCNFVKMMGENYISLKYMECQFNDHLMRFHHLSTTFSHFEVDMCACKYQSGIKENQI